MELHPCFRGNLGSRDGLPEIPRLGNASPLVRHQHPSNHPRSPSTRGQTSSTAPAAMRFDFHPIASGWCVSEANTDVPGGWREGASVPRLAGFAAGHLGRRHREARTHWTGRSAERSQLPRRPAGSPDFPHRARIASDRLQPDPNSRGTRLDAGGVLHAGRLAPGHLRGCAFLSTRVAVCAPGRHWMAGASHQ
jgi:hypothetical protein